MIIASALRGRDRDREEGRGGRAMETQRDETRQSDTDSKRVRDGERVR